MHYPNTATRYLPNPLLSAVLSLMLVAAIVAVAA